MKPSDILRSLADKLDADGVEFKEPPSWQPTGDMTTDMISLIMGDHHAVATPERDANLAKVDEGYANAYWGGLFDVGALTLPDKAYLARMSSVYKLKTGKDIMRDGIIRGGELDIRQARHEGEAWRNNYRDSEVTPVLRAVVERKLG
jgi:hypothetical protein